MRWIRWAIPVALLAFSAPASAQFYKYTDENGVVRFTDDLSKIPKDQREDTPAYWESKEPESAAGEKVREEAKEAPPSLPDGASEAELERESKRLETLRNELQREYEALTAEQERIKPDQTVTQSKYKAKEYNRQKAELRERARKYDEKRKAYEAAVKVYNEQIRALREAAQAAQAPPEE